MALAGYMRVLTPYFVHSWASRMINIHPSLLPAFPGLDTHARVLAAGVRFTGCTVHFVRPTMDEGPIIVQAAVPVEPDDMLARALQCFRAPTRPSEAAGRRVQVTSLRKPNTP